MLCHLGPEWSSGLLGLAVRVCVQEGEAGSLLQSLLLGLSPLILLQLNLFS